MDLKSGALNQPSGGGSGDAQAIKTMLEPMMINMTPAEGQTVVVPATSKKEIFLNLTPAADLDMVNVTLPAGFEGQRCFVSSTKTIANCHMGAAQGITVNNADIMFSPGDNAAYVFNKPNTWSRVLTS